MTFAAFYLIKIHILKSYNWIIAFIFWFVYVVVINIIIRVPPTPSSICASSGRRRRGGERGGEGVGRGGGGGGTRWRCCDCVRSSGLESLRRNRNKEINRRLIAVFSSVSAPVERFSSRKGGGRSGGGCWRSPVLQRWVEAVAISEF